MPRALKTCSTIGCPELIPAGQGRCEGCRARADRARGTRTERGYGHSHATRFRAKVLSDHPICVVCRVMPSVHADHYPLGRDELVRRGLNPNNPRYGRGLCAPCHSKHTAQAQPGGWANRT